MNLTLRQLVANREKGEGGRARAPLNFEDQGFLYISTSDVSEPLFWRAEPSFLPSEPSRAELYGFKNRAKTSLILFLPSFFETEIRAMILNFKIFIGIIMVPRNFY